MRYYMVTGTAFERIRGVRAISRLVKAGQVRVAINEALRLSGVTAGASVRIEARVATPKECAEQVREDEARAARRAARVAEMREARGLAREIHYTSAEGVTSYRVGDTLINDDTGERSRVVHDGRGVVLEREQ